MAGRLAKLTAHLVAPATSPAAGCAPVVITEVDSFTVECPLTAEQQKIMEVGVANMTAGPGRRAPFIGFYYTTGVTRIRTSDPSITGYGWSTVPADEVAALIVGQDPMDVERLLSEGLGKFDGGEEHSNTARRPYMGAENALWDIVGKICCQPLHKLWGSFRSEMPLYLTTVWPVDHHQDEVTPAQQAADLLELKERGGYNAFKFRIQRADWRDDVEAVRLCKEALGPDSKVMVDRTGDDAGDWTHEEALAVAHALKEVGGECVFYKEMKIPQ